MNSAHADVSAFSEKPETMVQISLFCREMTSEREIYNLDSVSTYGHLWNIKLWLSFQHLPRVDKSPIKSKEYVSLDIHKAWKKKN